MKKHPVKENACPLAAVDRRLADAHRLWHQAEAAYFDPDEFRLAIQNAIQTLRTVTFVLQNHKAVIPNFADWYGDVGNKTQGKWQQRLGSDPLMRWMVDARNKIEKQGDLEANSIIRAEIIASYLDEGPRIEVPSHLFDPIKTLLHNIPRNALGHHIQRNGMLRIQRRWVENTLPDHELLDAVAVAYGKIAELVHDAHRQIGLNPPPTIHDDEGRSYDLPSMGWRFPCMIDHESPRTLLISLADGSRIDFEAQRMPMKFDASKIAAIKKRYRSSPIEAVARDHKTDADLATSFFELVRAVFLRDRYHQTMLFLFRSRKMIGAPIGIVFENTQHKYALMRHLASEVTKSGADAAILVSESWKAPANELKPYERPSNSAVRQESLTLHLVSKDGSSVHCEADIIRDRRKVSLGKTQVDHKAVAFEFAPFLQAWGLNVPESWLAASYKALAVAKRE